MPIPDQLYPRYGSTPVGMLKNQWGECSEVVLACGLGVFGAVGTYMLYLEDKKTGQMSNRAYKDHYTVYRPNDPAIVRLKEEWYANGAPPMTSTRLE